MMKTLTVIEAIQQRVKRLPVDELTTRRRSSLHEDAMDFTYILACLVKWSLCYRYADSSTLEALLGSKAIPRSFKVVYWCSASIKS